MKENTHTLSDKFFTNDVIFNEIFPLKIRLLANRHWTPIHVTKLAAEFLASDGCKVLDIGSGAGKFCLAGAYYASNTQFTGIEQRRHLIDHALAAQKILGIRNASFIHGNFTQLNLREYDHFYFFNSFYENIDDLEKIDENIECSEALFEYYVRYMYAELQKMPKGTRIATFHTFHGEIPMDYEIVGSHHNGDLIFWVKS